MYIITTIFIYYYEHSYIFSNIYKSINIIKKHIYYYPIQINMILNKTNNHMKKRII